MLGRKKAKTQATAISHYKTGKLVVSTAEIKKVSLNYCKETLQNNETPQDYLQYMNNKKDSVENQLLDCNGSFSISKETFNLVLKTFKMSRKNNYDFLVRAGNVIQNVVFKLCQEMILKEEFPKYFQDTTLHMIFKAKEDDIYCQIIDLYIPNHGGRGPLRRALSRRG